MRTESPRRMIMQSNFVREARTRPIHRPIWAGLLAATLLAVPVFVYRPGSAAAAGQSEKPAASQSQPSTTQNDQTDLGVTVYNSNVALVRDVRELTLPTGEFRLRFMDIAATINPATVHFRSLTEPTRLGVVEQNYEYDLLDPQKLLQKYVGREVTLVRTHQENGTTKWEEIKATLLAYNNGPVWKIGNDIVTGMGAESYRFAELPENLYSRPTLLWELENSGARRHRVEASYLAGNISWSADYVLTVGREDKAADLDGWVTLVNNTGAAFKNAMLQLVAVDLHRITQMYYHNAQHPGSPLKHAVRVYFKFKNEEKGGLGMPLPGGVVRVYQADSKGGVQFVGEDRINHTPKDETLSVQIGSAFDVVCERKQIDFKKLADRLYEMEFEITLRNHKETPITVEVNEPIGGDWQMIESTHKWTKTDAWAAKFQVPVAKDGTSVLKYRVRVRW